MQDVTVITKEVDIPTFNTGIFMWGANIISPVAVYPDSEFQTLQYYYEETKTISVSIFFLYHLIFKLL